MSNPIEDFSEEEQVEFLKSMFLRNAPNDIGSPEGILTRHDHLRRVALLLALLVEDHANELEGRAEMLSDGAHRLRDTVEDHERMLRIVLQLREILSRNAMELSGPLGSMRAGAVSRQLKALIESLDVEIGKLYMTEI